MQMLLAVDFIINIQFLLDLKSNCKIIKYAKHIRVLQRTVVTLQKERDVRRIEDGCSSNCFKQRTYRDDHQVCPRQTNNCKQLLCITEQTLHS